MSAEGELKEVKKLDFRGATALVLDRDMMCVQVLAAMLNGFGIRGVHKCALPNQATDTLNLRSIDIFIMDPGGFGDEGYAMIDWLRGARNHPSQGATVILTSGYPTVSLISRMKKCNADYVLCKPFSTGALFDRLMWVASHGAGHGQLLAPASVVSASGSGVDLW